MVHARFGATTQRRGTETPPTHSRDRGLVVLVESRPDRGYFRRLDEALPPDSKVVLAEPEEIGALLAEVGIGTGASDPHGSGGIP